MQNEENIYEKSSVPQEEEKRLARFGEYLFSVSRQAIGENIQGKSILDIGAGPNVALGDWVKKEGGKYTAFDIQKRFLEIQKGAEHEAVQGTVEQLPFAPGSMDITHTRLVLMHLSPERRKQAFREIIQTARGRNLFLEPDWNAFRGNALVNQFRDLALKFLTKHADPYLGLKLKDEIARAAPEFAERLTETRVPRPVGPYYEDLSEMMSGLMGSIVQFEPALVPEAEGLADAIKEENHKKDPEGFSFPDMIVVELKH